MPDIGGAEDVDVIDVLVKSGDKIKIDDPLITLESDKASMDVPSPFAGEVKEVSVKVGDKVSEGDLILSIKVLASEETVTEEKEKAEVKKKEKEEKKEAPKKEEKEEKKAKTIPSELEFEELEEEPEELPQPSAGEVHAGPAVRRIAREFGVDLTRIKGTGEKGRILKEDVQKYVKQQLKVAESAEGFALPPLPKTDFAKFGEVETKPLTKIKKLSGSSLHRNWVSIPHVTQLGEADFTEMEAFRQEQKEIAQKKGFKLTPLVFIMKAIIGALKEYPVFNSSLDDTGENLIMKKYFHIGVAVDTPNGLVVPVIRDVDKKGFFDLAKELGAVSERARKEGLKITDMQGGCFSISSLGGIGGTAFTPIINAPEVAILGVSKSYYKPVFRENKFVPRLMLPLSLSYDHRVIDGADGARFMVYLSELLADHHALLL